MTLRRRLSGEIYENGVSYRVAVCRKRLRVSRTIPRAQSKARFDSHSLTSPTDANDAIAWQLLPRHNQLAPNPGIRALNEVGVEAGVEPGAVPQGKAEDT